MNTVITSAFAALAAGISFVASAQATEVPTHAPRNVVLVHGAFVDETSWQPVAQILKKDGYNVTLVKNPLTSLDADVAATKKALAKQKGSAILVGHSWGGAVITEAGNDPKVKALVYVSAFAPDVGESLASLSAAGPASEGAQSIKVDKKGFLFVDPAKFPAVVAADLPDAIGQQLAKVQLPLNHVAFEAKLTAAAWQTKPSYFVVSAADKMIPPDAQRMFASRMKAVTSEVSGSHASLVSHAAEVAAVIEKAAAASK